MTITPFPHTYQVVLDGGGDERGMLNAGLRAPIPVGTPPEFGGDDRRWSPEHLLLGAASACLMATFASVAAKSKLAVSDYHCEAEGVLDKTAEGLRFTRIVLKVTVTSAEPEKAARLMETAKKYCIVSNSLARPVEVDCAVLAG